MSKIEQAIWNVVEPIAAENNLELVEVEFIKEGADWYLRVYIDKNDDTSIELDDCELVSRKLSEKLDENDPIEQAYRLEVSSPGIERPLKREKDFIRFAGEKIKIRTFSPLDGQKEFLGILERATDEGIVIAIDGIERTIPREKISRVNLVWEF